MNLFDKLNNKQIEAVRATEVYVRVIAGAGSGKTKLLVSRYDDDVLLECNTFAAEERKILEDSFRNEEIKTTDNADKD